MGDAVGLMFRTGIRECRASDLRLLEWYGMHWGDRELIRRAFRRVANGKVRMLVADADGHPVGQVWIDLAAKSRDRIAVLWALRVHPMFSGKGLGSQVMLAAERVARDVVQAGRQADPAELQVPAFPQAHRQRRGPSRVTGCRDSGSAGPSAPSAGAGSTPCSSRFAAPSTFSARQPGTPSA
jgi:GNAT superfamily N-acetyltransferase